MKCAKERDVNAIKQFFFFFLNTRNLVSDCTTDKIKFLTIFNILYYKLMWRTRGSGGTCVRGADRRRAGITKTASDGGRTTRRSSTEEGRKGAKRNGGGGGQKLKL